MADAIKAQMDGVEDVSLTRSSGGVFEVTVDEALVYSKKAEGRFPETDEALKLVAAAA